MPASRAAWVAVAALVGATPAAAGAPVELELVLAVDASSSVDDGEFALQMQGIAAAFRNPDVQAAIRGTGDRGIAGTPVADGRPDSPLVVGVSGEGPRPSPGPDAASAAFVAREDMLRAYAAFGHGRCASSPAPPPVSPVGTGPGRGS